MLGSSRWVPGGWGQSCDGELGWLGEVAVAPAPLTDTLSLAGAGGIALQPSLLQPGHRQETLSADSEHPSQVLNSRAFSHRASESWPT